MKQTSSSHLSIIPHEKIKGMIKISAGNFLMGMEGWGESESPVHSVYLDDFWLDEAPVTNRQFAVFVKETNYTTQAELKGMAWGYENGEYKKILGLNWKTYFNKERENHPVVLVSWHDANAYAKWIGKRLPTEAEWEKAARGNLEGKLYPWGNEAPNGLQCNFANQPTNLPPTKPVKHFPANGYGLYDMVGNVWQWCEDWFEESYYSKSPAKNPKGPIKGEFKIRRGGSWNVIQAFRLRNSNRGAIEPHTVVPNIGFRCAL